ncbi:MAG: hypothetical protein EOP48_32545 [Sphingobacteriales bacterium]|nr:MAG: hypothetical protein EOP48_32545 [Sphingobacteriales bacterium]
MNLPDGNFLMICRLQNNESEGFLGVCYLNSDFKPGGRTSIIRNSPVSKGKVMLEDPRLFRNKEKIYLSHVESSPYLLYNSYTLVSEITDDTLRNALVIDYKKNRVALNVIDKQSSKENIIKLPVKEWQIEKNWQFFIRGINHYAIYNANKKHEIVEFDKHTGAILRKFTTYYKTVWNHGRISGGASPVLFSDNFYYSFFHSWTTWNTPTRKENWEQRQYHIGVYAFESVPPFRIKKMSLKPILSGSNTDLISASGHSVVFPGSAFYDSNSGKWILAVGWNDMFSKLLFMDHDEVKLSLVDVKPVNSAVARTTAMMKRTYTLGMKMLRKIKNNQGKRSERKFLLQ